MRKYPRPRGGQGQNQGPGRQGPGRQGAERLDDASKPCFPFKNTGKCPYGDRCKYSHGPAAQAQGSSTPSATPSTPRASTNNHNTPQDGKLQEWKRIIKQASYSTSRPAQATTSRLFQLGLELMDGDTGAAQEAIKSLVSDEGLPFIKDIAERHIPAANESRAKLVLWTTQIRPLFQLVTHPRVVNSAVLEQEIAGIFSYMLGVGGDRMVKIFDFIISVAGLLPNKAMPEVSCMSTVELSLAVLSKILDCNTTNIVNDHFGKIAANLAKFLELPVQADDEFSKRQASKFLEYIQRRLEVGDNIPAFQAKVSAPVVHETFVLRRDLPGCLSAQGRRHDNDHANIADIGIMPTYQEIMSPRAEYLPTTDPSQWHLQGIRGRLDREFRLLREDTVGQLRDAIREMLQSLRTPPVVKQQQDHKSQRQNSARTYTYGNSTIHGVNFDKRTGLQVMVQCTQPAAVQKMGVKERRQWWETAKRLQAGALVCMLDATGSLLFFVVADSTLRTVNDKPRDARSQKQKKDTVKDADKLTLSEDPNVLYVQLEMVDAGKHEVTQVLRWSHPVPLAPQRHLVEFPGVLLASFKYTLQGLQQMHQKPDLPFTDLIAPTKRTGAEVVVPAPLYATTVGFEFDLKCLTQDNKELSMQPNDPPNTKTISARTGLDPTQSEALVNTLSRQVSLIQGPPGTGKSYTGEKIIKVLLANKTKAKLGPIICVCYTNHALDQLLEHLLEGASPSIIRMGSRSKSEKLQGLNLRVLTEKADRTRFEKRDLWQLGTTIDELEREFYNALQELERCDSVAAIQKFLAAEYIRHHQELFANSDEEEEWSVVDHKRGNVVDRWLRGGAVSAAGGGPPRSVHVLTSSEAHVSLDAMTRPERAALRVYWVETIQNELIGSLAQTTSQYASSRDQRDSIRQEVDLRCLQQADVVGITTAGLARQLSLLRRLRCKVMLCEEAGEVLEAHILTTLLPSVEHAIMIGDHLQLRPQIQNYELQSNNPRGAQYSLDMSLFERLVQPPQDDDPRLPVSVLETQRRMHPSIAQMVRSTLYPALKDADNVYKYPSVVGIKQRLFWLHHKQLEAGANSNDPINTSHSNDFETKMVAALVSHLVRQGEYTQGEIAVLTPYLGQLQKLRRQMESMVEISVGDRDLEDLEVLDEAKRDEGNKLKPEQQQQQRSQGPTKTTLLKSVRLATVDNFQGEEAKVVIISLVRSNPQRKCGFLSTSNRINVLLSRAKHGCYIIGNAETYAGVPMWAKIINQLETDGNLGPSLALQCPRHPETRILVSEPDHFLQFSPDGGCQRPCDKRLACGHACHGRCHSDLVHSAFKCLESCPRPKKGCDHACPRVCGDACEDRCHIRLKDRLELPCGHSVTSAECWQAQSPSVICCQVPVARTVPGCGHSARVACCVDVSAPTYVCRAECGQSTPCGHECRSPCYQCNKRTNKDDDGGITVAMKTANHGICQQVCARPYTTCQHTCLQTCHGESKCKPCEAPCEVRCSHSRCSKPCHEPCAPCAEGDCASRCEHTRCTMPCAAPCDWVPCSKRCESKMDCGHQCPSICGETCPSPAYCQICGTDAIKTTTVDYIGMEEYHEIDLNADPCIFPDCGHFLTVSSMDGQMSMAAQYTLDPATGHPISLTSSASAAPFSMDEVKTCPQCRGSLRSIARYGRIVRRAMLDEATKKFIAWSSTRHAALAERLVVEQASLEEESPAKAQVALATGREGTLELRGERQIQLHSLKKWTGDLRYARIYRLWHAIKRYIGEVRVEEQPFQRVEDLVRHANHTRSEQDAAGGAGAFEFDEGVIQLRGYLMAVSLLLRCDVIILSDFLELRKSASHTRTQVTAEFSESLAECELLVGLAEKTGRPQIQAEGHVYYARFCVFTRMLDTASNAQPQSMQDLAAGGEKTTKSLSQDDAGAQKREDVKRRGLAHVAQARALLLRSPGQVKITEDEVDGVEKMLNSDGVLYRPVTADEMRAVYLAMAGSFSGTGHWYTCARGHPFTIGECGMAMEQTRCPECGEAVGGANHRAAEGVRHAREIEQLARGVANVEIV